MQVPICSSASSVCKTAFPIEMEPEDLEISHQPERRSRLKIMKATHSWRPFSSFTINFDACQFNCKDLDLDWNEFRISRTMAYICPTASDSLPVNSWAQSVRPLFTYHCEGFTIRLIEWRSAGSQIAKYKDTYFRCCHGWREMKESNDKKFGLQQLL